MFSKGPKCPNSLTGWIVTLMVVFPSGSSWARKRPWRRSSRTWTRMEMDPWARRLVLGLLLRQHFSSWSRSSLLCLQEFTKICKHLTPQQVEEGFAKFDTSGDNRCREAGPKEINNITWCPFFRLDYREFCQMIHAKQQNKWGEIKIYSFIDNYIFNILSLSSDLFSSKGPNDQQIIYLLWGQFSVSLVTLSL